MSTRSLTVLKSEQGKQGGKDLVTIYRQSDGYPTGHGKDLADFLNSRMLCNGIGAPRADGKIWANGLGCLAAQLVKELKQDTGGIYIFPNGSKDCGEDYKYIVGHDGEQFTLKVYRVSIHGKATLLFDGPSIEFNGEAIEKGEN